MNIAALQPHQQRVVQEKLELDIKLNALSSFFGTAMYKSLHTDEQARLTRQHRLMTEYSAVLQERIDTI